MRTRTWFGATVAVIGACLSLVSANAEEIKKLVVFGDSYASTGNLYALTGGGWPAPPMYPSDGRWSNGPIWIDYLASLLKVESPQPSMMGGTNYAWAGATSGFVSDPYMLPPIGVQVYEYLGSVDGKIHQGGQELHVIAGGLLDYLMLGNPDYETAAKNIAEGAGLLASAGAKRIMVATAVAGDLQPDVLNGGGEFNWLGLTPADLQAFIGGFNETLAAELRLVECQHPRTIIFKFDLTTSMRRMVIQASDHGFSNTTDSAYFAGGNPDEFVFWDTAHMTTSCAVSAPLARRIQRGRCE